MVSLGLSGCIAFPIGGEEKIAGSWKDGEPVTKTVLTDAVVLHGLADSRGNDVLSVGAEMERIATRTSIQKGHSLTVAKRKWFAVGFMPCVAESFWAPENGLKPEYAFGNGTTMQLSLIFGSLFSVFAPFERAECSDHCWKGPNAEYLLRLSPEEYWKIGARVEMDGFGGAAGAEFSHFIVGFLKFCTYAVSEPEATESAEQKEVRRRERVAGPYDVELSIPDLSWHTRDTVEEGQYRTRIALPFAFPPGTYEAELRFRFPRERIAAEKSAPVRKALAAAPGKPCAIRFTIAP